MKLPFLNRQKEIQKIKKAIEDRQRVLIVIYGRRRCGKSTLLQHILRKQDIYYLADQRESALQRETLAREIDRIIPNFASVQYPSWEALLLNLNIHTKSNSW